ncbi:MAG: FeoB-associated Cys-rich membrane protein [Mogibacterium sp.]|nr:FeoB-associated Cys-rich membrane protein [Mogibacterium sp.]
MNTATVLGIAAIALILFLAARYIVREKKKGNTCIGCPYADSCPKHRSGCNHPDNL